MYDQKFLDGYQKFPFLVKIVRLVRLVRKVLALESKKNFPGRASAASPIKLLIENNRSGNQIITFQVKNVNTERYEPYSSQSS